MSSAFGTGCGSSAECCESVDDRISLHTQAVMAGLVPATHAEPPHAIDVDQASLSGRRGCRDKPGHDDGGGGG